MINSRVISMNTVSIQGIDELRVWYPHAGSYGTNIPQKKIVLIIKHFDPFRCKLKFLIGEKRNNLNI